MRSVIVASAVSFGDYLARLRFSGVFFCGEDKSRNRYVLLLASTNVWLPECIKVCGNIYNYGAAGRMGGISARMFNLQ